MFGDGDCGQLGLGEEVTERLRPFPISVHGQKVHGGGAGRPWGMWDVRGPAPTCAASAAGRRSTHVPPIASPQVLQIACGGMHTVALTLSGEIWSWGVNDEGALGRETGARRIVPCAAAAHARLPALAVLQPLLA